MPRHAAVRRTLPPPPPAPSQVAPHVSFAVFARRRVSLLGPRALQPGFAVLRCGVACRAVPCHAPVPPYRLPLLREAPVTPQECVWVIIAQTGHVAAAGSWERPRRREVRGPGAPGQGGGDTQVP